MNKFITFEEAIELLYRTGCSSSVIQHCRVVSRLAVKLARKLKRNGTDVDVRLVTIGGLLHDIGRSKTHKIDHGVVGATIIHSFGLPISIVQIVERHIGSGIPAEEAVELGLPNKDLIPETLEEKIVSYADKLIEGDREISFDEALKKLRDDLGEFHPAVKRFEKAHSELFQKLGE